MPVAPTYPGVYVEEIPSGVRTIVGVATSITAFVGRAARGPTDTAVTINSFGDFERRFGGLWDGSSLGFAVRDFYLNGGSQALIVRLFHDDTRSTEAAQEVVAAAIGGDVAAVAAAARAKANTFTNEPEKTAANDVATAAEEEAAKPTATVDSVKAAASTRAGETSDPSPYAKIHVGSIHLRAADKGTWGSNLRARVNLDNINPTNTDLFNLVVQDTRPGGNTERFLNLSVAENSPRRADHVLASQSSLVRWDDEWPATPIDLTPVRTAWNNLVANPEDSGLQDAFWALAQDSVTQAESKYARAKVALEAAQNRGATGDELEAAKTAEQTAKSAMDTARDNFRTSVSDGLYLHVNTFLPPDGETKKEGLYSLEQVYAQDGLFNLLCIPPYKESTAELDVDDNLIAAATAYCERHRAMLLVDAPKNWGNKSAARSKFAAADSPTPRSRNAALFFPRLVQPNPLHDNQMEEFAPCGAVAGIFARTDTQRGVWKAPAGLDATLVGVPQLSVPLTDEENGELNPLGINCLRAFPIAGRVVWGSRTLRGADQLADEYKYIPVRRLALYIEESLFRGLKWVVFEPNDEPLWAQIRLNAGAFMHNLFRQGAFQGRTPRDAYFVKCDKETTTQNDINLGIVNILVGFAPLKPAEFVIIKLQQMAGEIQT